MYVFLELLTRLVPELTIIGFDDNVFLFVRGVVLIVYEVTVLDPVVLLLY